MTPAVWLLVLPLVSVGGQTLDSSNSTNAPSQTLYTSEPANWSQTSERDPTTTGAGPTWSSAAPAAPTAPRAGAATSSAAPGGQEPGCMLARQGRVLLLVVGVLIVACVGLLVTASVLTWKLCQRRPYAGENHDLISASEFWMGSVERGKARHKNRAPARETCVLIGQEEKKQEEQGGAGGREAADETKGKAGAEEARPEAGAGPGSDPAPGADGQSGAVKPSGPTESGPSADPLRVELPGAQVVESEVTGCEDTHNHD